MDVDVKQHFQDLFADVVDETGADLQASTLDLAIYAADRSAHLATLTSDPGFNLALRAERDAVAMKAGVEAVQIADPIDARIVGAIHGGLALAAKLLA